MQDGGKASKVELKYTNNNQRGLKARRDIRQGEEVIFIPKTRLMTVFLDDSYNRRLIMDQVYNSIYLLQEMSKQRNKQKFFYYTDMLPMESSRNFPFCYKDEDLNWLTGSTFLDIIQQSKPYAQEEYGYIAKMLPEFGKQFKFEEFNNAVTLV